MDVNDAFVRNMNASLELDIDFDGTAADFAHILELFAIKVLELGTGYVKIQNILDVNDAFVRNMNTSLELDIDFDGTAADFAHILELFATEVLELGAGYVKI